MAGQRGYQAIAIGECMVELARGPDGRFSLGYGGDTFNTAVYMARAGLDVAYATLLGDDPYSAGIADLAAAEGVETGLIERRSGRNAGLYLIETSASGERSFHYWRDRAPARELFDAGSGERVVEAMRGAAIVYLSGITLSLYPATGLDRLAAALAVARSAGARVAMDGNFRPRGWQGDRRRAQETFERFWRLADIGLPSLEDEGLLWGNSSPEQAIARLSTLGVGEIVLKCGDLPAICMGTGPRADVAIPAKIEPVDTTAAGDSFNAAYLAARLNGLAPAQAALAGHTLAGAVVQHRGAIVPRTATAAALRLIRA